MKTTSIHQHFSQLEDPRVERTKKHLLINVIFIAFCAVLCGAEDWVSIERFGQSRRSWFKKFLNLKEGIPSHDTFNRVFSILDSKKFLDCFTSWIELMATRVKKVIAIDGKSLRATKNKVKGLGPLHVVNVWCCENQVVLGQKAVDKKANEMSAIAWLVEALEIKGSTITVDAAGCHKILTTQIREKKADYLITLKGNQPNLFEDTKLYMNSLENGSIKGTSYSHNTVEKEHGRLEEREYKSVSISKEIRPEGWSDLNTVVKVDAKRTIIGEIEETSVEERYFISSLKAENILEISQAIRQHWRVENQLHWSLDVSFNEDQWRSKLGNAGVNMSLLNKMALAILKKEGTAKCGVKNKRLMAGWDENYLAKVLMGLST